MHGGLHEQSVGHEKQRIDKKRVTAYSYIMSTKEKLLAKIRNNPAGISFKELCSALGHCGWELDHQTGSHVIWRSPAGFRLPLQKRLDGKAKGYQVKQFIEQHTRETVHEKK